MGRKQHETIFVGETLKELIKVTESWLGAPYHHMGTSRGGVDCTKLIALVLVELDILSHIEPSYYGKDWYFHGDLEILLTAFYKHIIKYLRAGYDCDIYKYREKFELLDGDIITFSSNDKGISNHSGMYIDHQLFHTIEGSNTVRTWFSSHWQSKATNIFRIKKC